MNATLNIISPLCVIQTLLTLLKNWCLSPPLYLLLQSRGRFLTVLFISFFTDLFFENLSRKIIAIFRNSKAKKLILFSIIKVNQKVAYVLDEFLNILIYKSLVDLYFVVIILCDFRHLEYDFDLLKKNYTYFKLRKPVQNNFRTTFSISDNF